MCTFISLHRWNMLTPRMCKNIINHYDQLYHILPRISPILHFGSFQAQDIRVPARNTRVTNWDPCHGQLILRSKSWKIRVKHKKIRWCPGITIRIRNQSKILWLGKFFFIGDVQFPIAHSDPELKIHSEMQGKND